MTPPSVAAIGIENGYLTPEALSFSAALPSSVNVRGNVVMPALANIVLL